MGSASNSNCKVECVIVGPNCSGKTAMLNVFLEERPMRSLTGRYSHGTTKIDYGPTIFENCFTTMKIDEEDVAVNVLDTGGHPDFVDIFGRRYPEAEVFILVVSYFEDYPCDSWMESGERELNSWKQQLQAAFDSGLCPPIVVVGAKIELRGKVERTNRRTGETKDNQ